MNLVSKLKNKKSLNIIYENNNINSNSLLQIIEYNTIILKKLAIKKKDTIAIVLENGPEFITSFLSCINSTVAAPLNPNYTASEFDFYFKESTRFLDEKSKHERQKNYFILFGVLSQILSLFFLIFLFKSLMSSRA